MAYVSWLMVIILMMGLATGLKPLYLPRHRSEKTRASYVAISSVGENPRPQLDSTEWFWG